MVEDAVNTAAGRLRADIGRTREDLRRLARDLANLLKSTRGVGRSATTRVGGRFKDMPGAVGGKVGDAIEARPIAVIGTAFAAGLIAGMLLGRRG
jgi:hypothetical protein